MSAELSVWRKSSIIRFDWKWYSGVWMCWMQNAEGDQKWFRQILLEPSALVSDNDIGYAEPYYIQTSSSFLKAARLRRLTCWKLDFGVSPVHRHARAMRGIIGIKYTVWRGARLQRQRTYFSISDTITLELRICYLGRFLIALSPVAFLSQRFQVSTTHRGRCCPCSKCFQRCVYELIQKRVVPVGRWSFLH